MKNTKDENKVKSMRQNKTKKHETKRKTKYTKNILKDTIKCALATVVRSKEIPLEMPSK